MHSAGLDVSHNLNFDSEPFCSRLDCSPNPRPVPSLEDQQQPRFAILGTIYLVKNPLDSRIRISSSCPQLRNAMNSSGLYSNHKSSRILTLPAAIIANIDIVKHASVLTWGSRSTASRGR